MTNRGLLFFLVAGGKRGGRHAVMLAVALYSLRQNVSLDIQVHVVAGDEKSAEVCRWLSQDERLHPLSWNYAAFQSAVERCYAAKTRSEEWTPFDDTIFCDADLIFLGSLDELWPIDQRICFTQFCDWTTLGGKIIRGRLERWRSQVPVAVEIAMQHDRPAINTGIFSWRRGCEFFRDWRALSDMDPKRFLGDETSGNLLLSMRDDWRILDSRWNLSIHFQEPGPDTRAVHGHGNKFLKGERGPKFWRPWFQAALASNAGGLAEWIGQFDLKED